MKKSLETYLSLGEKKMKRVPIRLLTYAVDTLPPLCRQTKQLPRLNSVFRRK